MTKTLFVARAVRFATAPEFQHDCDQCMFLGTVDAVDMYYCPKDDCYIKRTGDRPEQNGAISLEFAPFPPGTEYALAIKIHERAGKDFRPRVWVARAALASPVPDRSS